tara:strand:- start:1524 stop:1697 length:174 start_codon:yes stop_codon:yes gene_type:complete
MRPAFFRSIFQKLARSANIRPEPRAVSAGIPPRLRSATDTGWSENDLTSGIGKVLKT